MNESREKEPFIKTSQEITAFDREKEPVFEAKAEGEPRLPLIKERVLAIGSGGPMGPMSEKDWQNRIDGEKRIVKRSLIKVGISSAVLIIGAVAVTMEIIPLAAFSISMVALIIFIRNAATATFYR